MPDLPPHGDAEREAYERGLRRAFVDAELDSHEKRLNAINGSIDRNRRETTRLSNAIEALDDNVKRVVARLDQRDAIEQDRNTQLKKANEQQISTRAFWLGVVAILAALIAPHLLHGTIL